MMIYYYTLIFYIKEILSDNNFHYVFIYYCQLTENDLVKYFKLIEEEAKEKKLLMIIVYNNFLIEFIYVNLLINLDYYFRGLKKYFLKI